MKQHNKYKRKIKTLKSLILFVMILSSGVFIGANFLGRHKSMNSLANSVAKYREFMSLIETSYVDSVDVDTLVEYSLKKVLERLDPHSVYHNAVDAKFARSQLGASFDGIGIEYLFCKDTMIVVNVLHKGPSEKAGIEIGDKIVKVDGMMMANSRMTASQILSQLRGARGSEVILEVLRGDNKNALLIFSVIRDKILSFSVPAGYMIDSEVGYIKVDRFTETTYDEFKYLLQMLRDEGMKSLLLDLRGNPGGYKDKAEKMVDELLDGDKLIVSTDGKGTQYDTKTYCKKTGVFEKGAIVLLIDENSASASEIVAGALQDNDRALIVGRRSFGKGLVQMPMNLNDGSELRLTISRYYTPSGRSIQKPYSSNTNFWEYGNDNLNRLKAGEFFIQDSIKFNQKLKFKTLGGRTVYGGGGIIPDVFVAKDTSKQNAFYKKLFATGFIQTFCFAYAKNNKSVLGKHTFKEYNKKFSCTEEMITDFMFQVKKQGITFRVQEYEVAKPLIKEHLKAIIAKNIFKKQMQAGYNNEYWQIANKLDPTYLKALQSFDKAEKLSKGNFLEVLSEKDKN